MTVTFYGNGGVTAGSEAMVAVKVKKGSLWKNVVKTQFFYSLTGSLKTPFVFTFVQGDHNTIIPPDYIIDDDINVFALYKILLSDLSVGDTLGGKKLYFDTSKHLARLGGAQSAFDIEGQGGMYLRFWGYYHPTLGAMSVYLELRDDPYIHGPFLERVYHSSLILADTSYMWEDSYVWDWYMSELDIPAGFGTITNVGYPSWPSTPNFWGDFFFSGPPPPNPQETGLWGLDDGWYYI